MLAFLFLLSFLFILISWLIIPFRLPKLFGDIANSSPIFCNFPFLPAHFDEKAPIQYFPIITFPNEVDGINPSLKDDLKRSLIIILNLDKTNLTEGLNDILLDCIVITLDQIQGDILVLIIQ